MKILKNNFQNAQEVTCSYCKSKLLIEPDDLHYDGADLYYICAVCGSHTKFVNREPYEDKTSYYCDRCGKPLPDEKREGALGCYWITCPHCNEDNLVEDGEELTPDNVEFPLHFFGSKNAVRMSDEQINKWVRECLGRLDVENDYTYTGSGDTFVAAFKTDEESSAATVFVCRDYYECDVKIPEEKF